MVTLSGPETIVTSEKWFLTMVLEVFRGGQSTSTFFRGSLYGLRKFLVELLE